MEKFLEAATIAWNPVGEVRRRLDSDKLTISSVLGPAIGAIIACNLLKMAAWNFFWNSFLQAYDPQAPQLATNEFAMQLASTVGALAPVAALQLLPARVFDPFGRSATGAALLVVAAANTFYYAAIAAFGYFIAGAQAWEDPDRGARTFQSLNLLMAIVVTGLTIFFWGRIGMSILQLRVGQFIAVSILALFAAVGVAGLIIVLIL